MYQDSVYNMFLKAIREKQQIVCVYHGLPREVCPHVLGRGKDGEAKALTFQFAGRCSKGLPPEEMAVSYPQRGENTEGFKLAHGIRAIDIHALRLA